MNIQRILQAAVYTRLGRFARMVADGMVIRDFVESCARPPSKRALLAYLVAPLLPPPSLRDRILFSNHGLAQHLAHALNELDYSVDVVHFDNPSWTPNRYYDLFIGHGGHQFLRFAEKVGGPKLYFSTGMYWRSWNSCESERLHNLTCRTGHLLPRDRAIDHSEEAANRLATGIICLGNTEAARTYEGFPVVARVNNAAFPLSSVPEKTHADTRRGFLFFAGRGNVHKGLDVLLEAVEGSSAELHVCQHIEPEFERVYERLLRLPNVHVHGFIKMRSPAFESIAARCSWVILPTCAEGQPGSVLECMAYGLIPVLPVRAHVDLGDFGVPIDDCSPLRLRRIMDECMRTSRLECLARSQSILATMARDYTPLSFRTQFKAAVEYCMRAASSTVDESALRTS